MTHDDDVLHALQRAVGLTHVELRSASSPLSGNYPIDHHAQYLARPADSREIGALLKICSELSLRAHCVSRGLNWGFGGTESSNNADVIISLERMNRILEIDPSLRTVTVQPGVTFADVNQELVTRGLQLVTDVTGAGPTVSMIGNALDRGIGSGPVPLRSDCITIDEVVLGSGDVHRFGANSPFTIARARASTGPDVTQLFIQSSLGIVTEATFSLSVAYDSHRVVVLGFDRNEDLERAILTLAHLREEGSLPATPRVHTSQRILSNHANHATYRAVYNENTLEDLQSRFQVANWTVSIPLRGTAKSVSFWQSAIEESVFDARIQVFDLSKNKTSDSPRPPPGLGDSLKSIPAFAHWSASVPVKVSNPPDSSDAGLFMNWFLLPARSGNLLSTLNFVSNNRSFGGAELSASITILDGRSVMINVACHFLKTDSNSWDAAKTLEQKIFDHMSCIGATPYRTRLEGPGASPETDRSTILRAIKSVLDPNHVLADTKYEADASNRQQNADDLQHHNSARYAAAEGSAVIS